jgi:hypothetical protein
MSISPRNLWPEDIAVTEAVAPVTVLKEQASLLGQQTQNLVEARVRPGKPDFGKYSFVYRFDLIAPALDGYTYSLFKISHDVGLYPLQIDFEDSGYPRIVGNEDQLMKQLEIIFASEKTKAIISSLIAQSRV